MSDPSEAAKRLIGRAKVHEVEVSRGLEFYFGEAPRPGSTMECGIFGPGDFKKLKENKVWIRKHGKASKRKGG